MKIHEQSAIPASGNTQYALSRHVACLGWQYRIGIKD